MDREAACSSSSRSGSSDAERGAEEAVPLLKMSSSSRTSSRSSSLSLQEKGSAADSLPFFLKSENANRPTSPPPMFSAYTQIPHSLAAIPRKYYRLRFVFGGLLLVLIALLYTVTGGSEGQLEPITDTADPTPTSEGEQNDLAPPEVLPPLYPEYFAYEDSLIQHHVPLHPGTQRKYIHWANHVHLLGFNNHLEEYLVNAHLAYMTNRSFVFYEYTWNPNFENEPYSEWYGRKIPSRVPESVLLGGWLAGGVRQETTLEPGAAAWDTTPVSRPFYNEVCPPEDRVYINAQEVMDMMMDEVLDVQRYPDLAGKRIKEHADGMQLLQAWKARLEQDDVRDAKCLEVKKDTGHAFDFWLFGSPTLHALWPSLAASPVLEHWSFSPLIYEAFRRNVVDLGHLGSTSKSIVSSEGWTPSAHDEQGPATLSATVIDGIEYDEYGYPPYPGERPKLPIYAPPAGAPTLRFDNLNNGKGNVTFEQIRVKVLPYPRTPQPRPEDRDGQGMLPVLALHLRRGDFEDHCKSLAGWGSSFMGFASMAEFEERDAFRPPQVVERIQPTEEGGTEGQRDSEVDGLRRRRGRAEKTDDVAEDMAAHAKVKVTVPSTGDVTSHTVFTGHAYDDPSTATSEERDAMYAKHCYPDNQQIVKRVRDVLKDWVGRRWISFLEQHERDIAGKRDENEAAYEDGLARWKNETLSRMKAVYIMTNGKKEWAAEVRKALRGLDGEGDANVEGLSRWKFRFVADVEVQREGSVPGMDTKTKRRTLEWIVNEWPWDVEDNYEGGSSSILITTARDLEFTLEEKYAAQAVDMYIGQRAEVFIGNGFSSMTANVAMLRKNGGLDPLQTRFW